MDIKMKRTPSKSWKCSVMGNFAGSVVDRKQINKAIVTLR